MTKLDGTNYNNYPLDVVVLQSEKMSWNYRKIYLINRDNMGPMINLEDHSNVDCCKGKVNSFFYAFNVTEPGKRTADLLSSVNAVCLTYFFSVLSGPLATPSLRSCTPYSSRYFASFLSLLKPIISKLEIKRRME